MVVLALAAGLLAGALALPDMALAANGYTNGNVNMRTGPGVNYPRIATIPRGAGVTIRGCVRNHRWCDVAWRGWRGWVSARYLVWTRYRRPIYRPGYPPLWGGPIIQFRFERYHDRWYRDRPWHRKRHWHPKRKKRVVHRSRHRQIVRRDLKRLAKRRERRLERRTGENYNCFVRRGHVVCR
jgi:uncharacterized protein YraI